MEVFLYIVVGFMLAFYGLYSGATPNEGAAAAADAADALAPADLAGSYGGAYGGEQLQQGARRALRTGAAGGGSEDVEDQVSELWGAALPPISPLISPHFPISHQVSELWEAAFSQETAEKLDAHLEPTSAPGKGGKTLQLVIVARNRRVLALQALMKPMWAVYGAFELEELGNAPIGVAR